MGIGIFVHMLLKNGLDCPEQNGTIEPICTIQMFLARMWNRMWNVISIFGMHA